MAGEYQGMWAIHDIATSLPTAHKGEEGKLPAKDRPGI